MTSKRNVLFIMCDQLRFDYLSCAGHKSLTTPNIDRLASRGVRFTNAYVQSTVCGPSRMSAYTGRYVRSHGSTHNGVPLRVGEPTLGDHLREVGVRCALIGKTHMKADEEGMERLGIAKDSVIGVRVAEYGFEPFERDDGLHPSTSYDPDPAYDSYLRQHGFEAENPWEHWANSGEGENGENFNGWLLVHADKAARIPEEHSETSYMTRRAMRFIEDAEAKGEAWCAHLSYIKPHWPYIVPAPYHAMYGKAEIQPPVRSEAERVSPNPIFEAFQQERYSKNFSRDEVRETVVPCYMGLIKQIDDQLGLLFDFMEKCGLFENTLVVFTSDHGDYLGDHWLGEKYLFHDVAVKVPMIVYDPRPEADVTRGTTSDALVEMIDLAPTFLDYFGGEPKPHVLEGRSLLSLTSGERKSLRNYAISEYDYSGDAARLRLAMPVSGCKLYMITDGRFKLVHGEGVEPMFFDLQNDPGELRDLGREPSAAGDIERLSKMLMRWLALPNNRITVPDEWLTEIDDKVGHFDPIIGSGVLIGYWDEAELAEQQEARRRWLTRRGK
ncbi:phosphonate monoester hydrolase [Mesorhizobium sp. M1A.F.Ca.ET.072.01.1.1]|uniref:sulfatase-like hydrolase/transferase n=1 Tax=Mesorhizobium sp. M1A.F.Ca.ET.072.01.1.1 TaxID=2496753 RepID=UPI000FD60801|nr:sulfatase-like hydrolase/transferase [Mesorhizobium sp. M1A.F.Ca.ET.072.01.1.1]RUW50444.1 phosphonate monoester hydrolase [Mesorhizobium sp. M1A.F.Ca.ET.072.01.1.1]